MIDSQSVKADAVVGADSRRFVFDRGASTRAGTTSVPNTAAVSWQVSGLWPSRARSASAHSS
ncbi:hypothetical protein [Streptomyces sp. JNUCC 63]